MSVNLVYRNNKYQAIHTYLPNAKGALKSRRVKARSEITVSAEEAKSGVFAQQVKNEVFTFIKEIKEHTAEPKPEPKKQVNVEPVSGAKKKSSKKARKN